MFSFRNEATTQMTQYTKKNISSHSTAFNLVLEISQKRTENKNYLKPISSFCFLAVATNRERTKLKRKISLGCYRPTMNDFMFMFLRVFCPINYAGFCNSSLLNVAKSETIKIVKNCWNPTEKTIKNKQTTLIKF